MKYGFTYKGKHSNEFGITVKTDDRPIYPEVKARSYEPLLSDGSYDFTAANAYGREFYKNRIFSVIMQIEAGDLRELNRKISRIAMWLCGSGDLIFDDTPMVKWQARCVSTVKYAPERRGKSAILTVAFEAASFGSLLWKTYEGPKLSDGVRLNSDIPMDMAGYYVFTPELLRGTYSNGTAVKLSAEFKIVNIGDRPLRPIITINYHGAGGRIKPPYICKGDNRVGASININRTTNEATLIYDFERQMITRDGERCKVDGEFFEINQGDTLTLELNTTLSSTVTDEFTDNFIDTYTPSLIIDANPKTVWDFDFDGVDWGNE